ncbi:hypothetical protein PIROE2DRAFT_6028 [Piromyces sp. E2]|nr:hypothetical protein PIROE2DRAFT_6028 [Piromyces sp. E2]|eukprot:OUM66711.1 hypothetical protein PIROE2DRAFT_6028 [Piromyces sp. E2]
MRQIHTLLVLSGLLVAVNAGHWGRGPWSYDACVTKVRDIYLDLPGYDESHECYNDYVKAIKKVCGKDYKCGKYLQNNPHTSGDRCNYMEDYCLPEVKKVISSKCKNKVSIDWTECGF